MRIIFALLMSLLLASCETTSISTLLSSFTTKNIMKVHPGMSSDEILQLFGEPKSIRSAVCGQSPDQWICPLGNMVNPLMIVQVLHSAVNMVPTC